MKIFLITLILILLAIPAMAQYKDDDGKLVAAWGPPASGNPVKGYALTYTVSSQLSPVKVFVTTLSDSSIVLTQPGEWALLDIRAVSIFNDTSIAVISDTAYFALPTGIDPPTGVIWR